MGLFQGILKETVQFDRHMYIVLVAHAVIDIVWMVFGERFRDSKNVVSVFNFCKEKKGVSDCL